MEEAGLGTQAKFQGRRTMGRSNCGQLGVSYTSGLFTGSPPTLCRQAGAATRLAVEPKRGDSILRPSWKLCNPSHAALEVPIIQKETRSSPETGTPGFFLSLPEALTGLFQGARQRRGSPSPSLCALPGLSPRYRLHMYNFQS